MSIEIIRGDCIEVMRTMPASSVDSIVTDPPYGLEFMGADCHRASSRISTPNPSENRTTGRSTNISAEAVEAVVKVIYKHEHKRFTEAEHKYAHRTARAALEAVAAWEAECGKSGA